MRFLRSGFGVEVIAIQRHGMHMRRKLSQHPLRVGDLLLVQGSSRDLERLQSLGNDPEAPQSTAKILQFHGGASANLPPPDE